MTDDYSGWNDAPEVESEADDIYTLQDFARPGTAGQGRTMEKQYGGLPAAANMQQSIILAQLQILKDMERRKQSAAAVELLIDSVTRLAA